MFALDGAGMEILPSRAATNLIDANTDDMLSLDRIKSNVGKEAK